MKKETVMEAVPETVNRFPKNVIITSARYQDNKDIVNALLNDVDHYTLDEVDEMISNFMERKVR